MGKVFFSASKRMQQPLEEQLIQGELKAERELQLLCDPHGLVVEFLLISSEQQRRQ